MVLLTEDKLDTLRSDSGAYTKATLSALGIEWGQTVNHAGWRNRLLLGKTITDDAYARALQGRSQFAASTEKKKAKKNNSLATPAQIQTFVNRIGVSREWAQRQTQEKAQRMIEAFLEGLLDPD